jgi:hypothetical protein
VSRELLPRGSYIKAINLHFRQVLEKHGLGRG